MSKLQLINKLPYTLYTHQEDTKAISCHQHYFIIQTVRLYKKEQEHIKGFMDGKIKWKRKKKHFFSAHNYRDNSLCYRDAYREQCCIFYTISSYTCYLWKGYTPCERYSTRDIFVNVKVTLRKQQLTIKHSHQDILSL